jgi:phage shock protein B
MHGILFVPLVLFVIFVAPIWIVLHYVTKWRTLKTLRPDDERMLGELWQAAARMEERIRHLEKILDAEAPGWRARQ